MSDSVRPHRRQPTRLPRPWDSPGKNTGVGCHFLLQCMKVKSESEVAQSCLDSSRPHGLQPIRLLLPWDFPGKSTGVGCHCLLQLCLTTTFKRSPLFILCWDFVVALRKGRSLIPLTRRTSIKERRLSWLFWNTIRWMRMAKSVTRSEPQMNVVLEFLWPVILTDIIVANVVWPTVSTNQKTSNCILVNKDMS